MPGAWSELYTHLLIEISAVCPLDALCPLFSQTAQHAGRRLHRPALSERTVLSSLSMPTPFLLLQCTLWCLVQDRLYQYLVSEQMAHESKGTEKRCPKKQRFKQHLKGLRERQHFFTKSRDHGFWTGEEAARAKSQEHEGDRLCLHTQPIFSLRDWTWIHWEPARLSLPHIR